MGSLTVDSPLGPLALTSRDGALVALDWGRALREDPDAVLQEAARQLAEYFAGTRGGFTVALAPQGTPFRQRVWAEMLAIPFGETLSYGAVARTLDSGPRAVGGACGANPLPIVIPCHRIVGGGGTSGGYSGMGGLDTKAWLLAHERRHAGGHGLPGLG